jgi:adenosylcobinamide kinase/adenosylcobinamide-phosphate guanylyltransferase
MKTLILGGVRSGKSRLAERLAQDSGRTVTLIATARADDIEMHSRIQHHQAQRPAHWRLVEEPLALAAALQQHATADGLLLVDCLTLWLTNLLLDADPARLAHERDALLDTLARFDAPAVQAGQLILVSNETGLGIVPMGELTRRYCDEAGRLHQALAARCERVTLVVAGLPLNLKGNP